MSRPTPGFNHLPYSTRTTLTLLFFSRPVVQRCIGLVFVHSHIETSNHTKQVAGLRLGFASSDRPWKQLSEVYKLCTLYLLASRQGHQGTLWVYENPADIPCGSKLSWGFWLMSHGMINSRWHELIYCLIRTEMSAAAKRVHTNWWWFPI